MTTVAPRRFEGGLHSVSALLDRRWVVYLLITAVTVSLAIYQGRELNWDALHYHLYLGFSALNDRSALDFFAAGPQGYLNPYALLPFYWMVRANIPALQIAIAFAVVHSMLLWLTYELASTLNPSRPGSFNWLALSATVLAAQNPLFIVELASTYTDITTAILVLAGWLILAREFRSTRTWAPWVAGAVLGVATALKLSNSIFAIATIVLVVLRSGDWRARARRTLEYLAVCALAFLVMTAPWAWKLWQEFHNPFFPMFNQYFHSPEFVDGPVQLVRFIPSSFFQGLTRPFEMAVPTAMVHFESRAPDIRYAALLICMFALAVVKLLRMKADRALTQEPHRDPSATVTNHLLVALLTAFVVAWILWLFSSGNSRYFLPMSCVGAVVLVTLLRRLFRIHYAALTYALVAIIGVQCVQSVEGTPSQKGSAPWNGPWFQTSIPARLKEQPFLYLSVDPLSGSFLLPDLAPGSGMMNISGGYVLDPNGAGGRRASELIERNIERLRFLTPLRHVTSEGRALPEAAAGYNSTVERFGLVVDPSDCEYIGTTKAWDTIQVGDGDASGHRLPGGFFYSCRLVRSPEGSTAYRKRQLEVDAIFDRVEDACPKLFQPRRTASEEIGKLWRRIYMNTDVQIWVNREWVKYFNAGLGGDPIVIGRESEWAAGPLKIDCPSRYTATYEGPHG